MWKSPLKKSLRSAADEAEAGGRRRMQAVAASPRSAAIAAAYDASSVTFRVLRAFGWGPLLNLGYYRFSPPLTLLNFLVTPLVATPFFRLPAAQLRLVNKAVALLDCGAARRVLDIGCGRGTSSYLIATAFPQAHVIGLDLLPDHIAVAHTLYINTPNLAYVTGDAMQLDFADRSFDRALCLEAAFHFSDRGRFLRELARVLESGGRAVIVDFMWKNDAARRLCEDDATRLVRAAWQWENFDSVRAYQDHARASGFAIETCLDWSRHVTAPLRTIFDGVARLAGSRLGRALMTRYHPPLRTLSDDDWRDFVRAANAHRHVHSRAEYVALVLQRDRTPAQS
jgi:SAM-dependent methyltransferase